MTVFVLFQVGRNQRSWLIPNPKLEAHRTNRKNRLDFSSLTVRYCGVRLFHSFTHTITELCHLNTSCHCFEQWRVTLSWSSVFLGMIVQSVSVFLAFCSCKHLAVGANKTSSTLKYRSFLKAKLCLKSAIPLNFHLHREGDEPNGCRQLNTRLTLVS